jgi:ParB family chromosome partitioning protein
MTAHPMPQSRLVPLSNIGLAPENPRAREPRDEGIVGLAETIFVAGLVVPLAVRPGRKGEKPFMALDGRRRFFALEDLAAAGRIEVAYPVRCEVFATPAAQAAAAVLTATERLPVHTADVIVAIGQLRKRRMDTAAIAASLGYDALDIRRLEALSAVHPKVLQAFREGRLTLRQVRLFARLKDKAVQAELAASALAGHFHEYRLHDLVTGDRVSADDARAPFVGLDRYAAAGGRVESDLFGELPDRLLDPEILHDLWRTRVQPIAEALEKRGLTVFIDRDAGYQAPDGFERLPYVYAGALEAEAKARLIQARAQIERAADALHGLGLEAEGSPAAVLSLLEAQLEAAIAQHAGVAVGAAILYPHAEQGVAALFFAMPLRPDDDEPDGLDGSETDTETIGARASDIEVPEVSIDTGGASHVLHEARTDVATRGLMRDLVDAPTHALTMLLAHLFASVALHGRAIDRALAIAATPYGGPRSAPISACDTCVAPT